MVIGIGDFGGAVVRTALRSAAYLGRLQALSEETSVVVAGGGMSAPPNRSALDQEAERRVRRSGSFADGSPEAGQTLASELVWLLSARTVPDGFGFFATIIIDAEGKNGEEAVAELRGVLQALSDGLEATNEAINQRSSVLVLVRSHFGSGAKDSRVLTQLREVATLWSKQRERTQKPGVSRILVSGRGFGDAIFDDSSNILQFATFLELLLLEGLEQESDFRTSILLRTPTDDRILAGFYIALVENRYWAIQYACCAVVGARVLEQIVGRSNQASPKDTSTETSHVDTNHIWAGYRTSGVIDSLSYEEVGRPELEDASLSRGSATSDYLQRTLEAQFEGRELKFEIVRSAERSLAEWSHLRQNIERFFSDKDKDGLWAAEEAFGDEAARRARELGRRLEEAVYEDLVNYDDPKSLKSIEQILSRSAKMTAKTSRDQSKPLIDEELNVADDLDKHPQVQAVLARIRQALFSISLSDDLRRWAFGVTFVVALSAYSILYALLGPEYVVEDSFLSRGYSIIREPIYVLGGVCLVSFSMCLGVLYLRTQRIKKELIWLLDPKQGMLRAALESALLSPRSVAKVVDGSQSRLSLSARFLRHREGLLLAKVQLMRREAIWLQGALREMTVLHLRRDEEDTYRALGMEPPPEHTPLVREYLEKQSDIEALLVQVERKPRDILRNLLETEQWVPHKARLGNEPNAVGFLDFLVFLNCLRDQLFGPSVQAAIEPYRQELNDFVHRVRAQPAAPNDGVQNETSFLVVHDRTKHVLQTPRSTLPAKSADRTYFLKVDMGLDVLCARGRESGWKSKV